MEPGRPTRASGAARGTLLRYAPFVARSSLAVVLGLAAFGRNDDGDSSSKPRLRPACRRTGRSSSRPPTRTRSTGDRSATRRAGTVAVPLTYAPPCVQPFTGDNGGATAPGVTGDTITIALYQAQPDILQQTFFQQSGSDESLAAEPRRCSSTSTFFESHYETYGRHVKIVAGEGERRARRRGRRARRRDQGRDRDQGVRVVGRAEPDRGVRGRARGARRAVHRRLPARRDRQRTSKESKNHVWLTFPSIEQLGDALEPVPRRASWPAAPAQFAGDPALRDARRGVRRRALRRELRRARPGRRRVRQAAAKAGGRRSAPRSPTSSTSRRAQENARNTIAKLKAAKVTTVIFAGDPVTPGVAHAGGHRAELLPRVGRARRGVHRHVAVRPQLRPAAVGARVRRLDVAAPCPRRSGPAVLDPRLAVGQGPGGQDVQGARAGAADLLHRAAPRRPGPHRRDVPRRACSASRRARRIRPDCTSRGATTASGRATDYFGSDDATADLVEPDRPRASTRSATRAPGCGSTRRDAASATCPASGRRASPTSSTRRPRSPVHARCRRGPAAELPVAGQVTGRGHRLGRARSASPTRTQPSAEHVPADDPRRVPDRDAEVRDLAGHHRAGADHRVLPDRARRAARSCRGRATRRRAITTGRGAGELQPGGQRHVLVAVVGVGDVHVVAGPHVVADRDRRVPDDAAPLADEGRGRRW